MVGQLWALASAGLLEQPFQVAGLPKSGGGCIGKGADPRTGLRRRYSRDGEHGQMIVLFALFLIAIIAMAGLLIDGRMAWANRRQAQTAADTAALAAAQLVAGANGFGAGTDCAGNPLNGVTVNSPPSA